MKILVSLATTIGICAIATSVNAGNVADGDIVTFTANTAAKASEVNANFTKLKEANNDNDVRITTNAANITTLQTTVTGKVDKTGDTITGNLTVNGTLSATDITYTTPLVGTVIALPTDCVIGSDSVLAGTNVGVSNPPANAYGPSLKAVGGLASTTYQYYCPIPLLVPPGATVTITGASLAYYDGTVNCLVGAEIRYKTFGTSSPGTTDENFGGPILATVYSGTNSSDFAATSSGPVMKAFPAFSLVMPTNRIVWVNAIIANNASGAGADCRYSGVSVDYTVSKP